MTPATSENKKKLCKARTDMITNLPPNLTQQILECLPLQDAARTSVLSRDWRYKWLSLAQITLDLFFSHSFLPRAYTDVVNTILLRHRGPIHKFVFDVPCDLPKASNIDCWIEFVCLNGVKEFYLFAYRIQELKLPSCLFSCVSLTHLKLLCGSFSLPPTFGGFPCLVSLSLFTNEDDNEKLESLINNCPQLESLELILCDVIDCLTIRATKLQHLVLDGKVHSLCLEENARIKTLELDIEGGNLQRWDMVDLLSSLPNIENLQISNVYGCGLVPPKLLAKGLEQLHTLNLGMPLACQYTNSLVLCLLKSSPNLSRLEITATECGNCDGNLLEFNGPCSLEALQHVRLLCFSGSSNEQHLVKFLLAQTPALKSMTIELDMVVITGPEAKFNLAKEVTRFCRASPNAEVILKP